MKKMLLSILLAAMLVLLISVSALGNSADEITADEYASMTTDDLLNRLNFTDPENLTVDEYIRLIGTYRFVEIDYQKLVLTNTWSITDQVRDTIHFSAADHPEYMPLLMASEYPQVRAAAYEQVFGVFGADSGDLDAAINALASETDPYCLYVAVKGVGNEMRTRKEIADFVFRMADHENPLIRRRAAVYIGSKLASEVDGTIEKLIAMMSDEDQRVREAACKAAGDQHNEAVIEPLVAILNNPEEEKIHGAAINGLSTLWLDYPYHEHASEAAYRATLNYYSVTPRTDKVPSWSGIPMFNMINKNTFDKWPGKDTWFDADEFFGVMADVIADPDMNWLGKEPAMKAILALCPEKWPELEPVMSAVDNEKVLDLYAKLKEKAENP